MKFRDGVNGLGADLIFSGESAEQAAFGDDIQNCLSFRRPQAGRLLNFRGRRRLGLGQQARSTNHNLLAIHTCLRASARQRLKISSLPLGYASTSGFFDDGFGKRCSELISTAAARAINSDSDAPATTAIPATAGEPRVSVPVLSNITMSSLRARSSASLSFTRRPFWAPRDVEMAITRGIASPKAWGQAMMRDGCGPDQRVLLVPREPPVGERNRARGDCDVKQNWRRHDRQGLACETKKLARRRRGA